MGITAKVNTASIQGKVNSWVKSADARQRAEEKVNEYIDSDVRQSSGGSRVLTVAWVNEMAQELAGMINTKAASTIGSHGINVTASGGGAQRVGSGGITASVDISADGGLFRPSLYPKKYGGVDNIVALFEHGYDAGGLVWGEWHGDYTWSLSHRDGEDFIHEAVDDFNTKYSGFGITVTIMGPYA